jgi:hypothetical protein
VTDAPQALDGVFINCPFDPAYRPMFDAVVLAVLAYGHRTCRRNVREGSCTTRRRGSEKNGSLV